MHPTLLLREPSPSTGARKASGTAACLIGGLLLVWSAGIHAHLWLSGGYRHIPTIGPLFLLQSVTGVVLGVMVVVIRRAWIAVVGAGFAASTVLGLVVTVEHGLFGFRDSWSAPFATQSVVVEIAAAVVLAAATLLCRPDTTAIWNRIGDE